MLSPNQASQLDGKELESFLYELFNHRCVSCKRPATQINHIIPRARGDSSKDWRNQVPQCTRCHNEFHHNGVTLKKITLLEIDRELFLTSLKRKKYI